MLVYTTEKEFHCCDDHTLLKPTWKEDGFFETLLWNGEELLDLKLHIERIEESLRLFYGLGLSIDNVAQKVRKLVEANGIEGRAKVRLVAQVADKGCVESIVVQPYRRIGAEISLRTSQFTPAKKSARTGHKHLKYCDYAKAHAEALEYETDEALLFNDRGELCEGATSNVFFVKEETIFTPSLSSGCLPGIMRRLVIESLRQQGVRVEEGCYCRADIVDSDFVFVTNSLRRVQSVAAIDGVKVASGGSEVLELLGNV